MTSRSLHTIFGTDALLTRVSMCVIKGNQPTDAMKVTSEKFDVYTSMKAKAKHVMRSGRRLDFANNRSAIGSMIYREARRLRRGKITVEEAYNFMDERDCNIPVPLSIRHTASRHNS